MNAVTNEVDIGYSLVQVYKLPLTINYSVHNKVVSDICSAQLVYDIIDGIVGVCTLVYTSSECNTMYTENEVKVGVKNMAIIGNTIKLRAEFRDYNGILYDPTSIELKIYDTKRLQLGDTTNITENDRLSIGVYEYEYVVPTGSGNLTYEFKGVTGSMPVVGRGTIIRNWT